MFPQNFRPQPFTDEELSRFTSALSKGRVVDVISLVSEMTPEKEIEVQKLVNHFSPIFKGYEEKVKGFLDVLESKEQLKITEPRQEEKVQRLINKELASVKNKNKIDAAINELNSLKANNAEEAAKIKETIKEHQKTLKELNADVAENITLENVRNILKDVTKSPENSVLVSPPTPKGLVKDESTKEESVKDETVTEEVKKEEKEKPVVEDAKPEETTEGTVLPAEEIKHTITEEDIEANPGLEKDVKVGDEVTLGPVVDEEIATEPTPAEPLLDSPTSLEPKQEEPAKVVGSSVKECCGSKGLRHKKLCPLKK